MGSNWLAVDTNFPSFTGKESPTEQIRALHNYLFCLKDQLQYSLNNLTADNWNADALQSMTEDAKALLSADLVNINNRLSQLQSQVNELQNRIQNTDELDARVTAVENLVTYLEEGQNNVDNQILQIQEDMADHEQRLAAQEEAAGEVDGRIAKAEADLLSLDDEVSQLSDTVADLRSQFDSLDEIISNVIQQGEGATTIGKAGAILNLVGEVYLNGVLLEQGGTNETA